MIEKEKTSENGYMILEATFCYSICMVVIVLLLSAGFYLYQLVLVDVVTNEVATEVAQNYKLRNVSDSSNITKEDVISVGFYRYLLFEKSFTQAKKATVQKYANSRLSKTSLEQGRKAPVVEIERMGDDIGRRHYRVTVSQDYTFLFGKILPWIGDNGLGTITCSTNVQGTDMLNMINSVKVMKYIAKGPVISGTSGWELGNSVISMINSGYKMIKALLMK